MKRLHEEVQTMTRITNQEQFITKANEIYGHKYDYSLVNYTKTSEKVKIICPEHGVFEKTPQKHLQGQGCPECGRNRTKVGLDEFVRRANEIHKGKYDYSKVAYHSSRDKVEIICPVHGSFWQAPRCHVYLKQGCPKCSAAEGGAKRRGENNVAHRDGVKQKKAETCMKRYGAKTWAASDEGRQRLHDIIMNDGKLDLMRATCQERYGTDFWTQSEEGRQVLHELMSSEKMRGRVADGYKAVYGMHYMQTREGRKKAKNASPYRIDGLRRKYNVTSPMKLKEVVQKGWATKLQNGTASTSKPEQVLYELLCNMFGQGDVLTQYKDAERYPFHCDFYVKSLDLFIELNAHWSHGGHWFDPCNGDDLALLALWQDRFSETGSAYYAAAIVTWTQRDLLKRETAARNHLNYIVFWQSDLSDAEAYLSKVVQNEAAV